MDRVVLTRDTLIYVPAFNCVETIVQLIREIPDEVSLSSDILVIDNCSSDGTGNAIVRAAKSGVVTDHINVIRTCENIGYSGSQKLAYSIGMDNPAIEKIGMLHGDGQYPPQLISELINMANRGYDVVYGYRDKSVFGDMEETPPLTRFVIRVLSMLESLVTGYPIQEWHTGFIMYSTDFLKMVNFDAVTDTYHIDGHLLFASGSMERTVMGVPIYKRYRDYRQLGALARVIYVLQVLRLVSGFRHGQQDLRNTTGKPYKSLARYNLLHLGSR